MNFKSILKLSFGLFGFLFLISCTTTRTASLTTKAEGGIELFTTKMPQKDYTEICYIQTDGGLFHTLQKLLDGLSKKATEMDIDAIIAIKYDFQAWYPVVSGIAIKYTE